MRSLALLPLALLCAAPLAAAQNYVIVAEDSFDYPVGNLGSQSGGTSWSNAWYAGGADADGQVITPGVDGIGNMVITSADGAGCYRKPDTSSKPWLTESLLFGRDNTTIWISFYTRRTAGGDDTYGGLSLYHQFVAEHLFLGSPNSQFEWGIHDDPWNNPNPDLIAGTNIDTLAWLVYRIDFLPGQERLRLWLDPATEHPSTTPDIDTMIHDFRFNEIGIKSGNSQTLHGWEFDAIRVTALENEIGAVNCAGDVPGICTCGNDAPTGSGLGCVNSTGLGARLYAVGSESIADQGAAPLVLRVENARPNKNCVWLQGAGAPPASSFRDGVLCVGNPTIRLPGFGCHAFPIGTLDSAGAIGTDDPTFGFDVLAAALCKGDDIAAAVPTVRDYQLWFRDGGGPCGTGSNLSNAVSISFVP